MVHEGVPHNRSDVDVVGSATWLRRLQRACINCRTHARPSVPWARAHRRHASSPCNCWTQRNRRLPPYHVCNTARGMLQCTRSWLAGSVWFTITLNIPPLIRLTCEMWHRAEAACVRVRALGLARSPVLLARTGSPGLTLVLSALGLASWCGVGLSSPDPVANVGTCVLPMKVRHRLWLLVDGATICVLVAPFGLPCACRGCSSDLSLAA